MSLIVGSHRHRRINESKIVWFFEKEKEGLNTRIQINKSKSKMRRSKLLLRMIILKRDLFFFICFVIVISVEINAKGPFQSELSQSWINF